MDEFLAALIATDLILPPEPVVAFTDEPKYPNFLCHPRGNSARALRSDKAFGIGIGLDGASAQVRAAAECLERLCLFNPPALASDVVCNDGRHVDPRLFQRAAHGAGGGDVVSQPLSWWPVLDCASGASVLVPAQAVFLAGMPTGEPRLRPEQSSCGAALGEAAGNGALERGLLEVLERDAAAFAYYSRRTLARIIDLPEAVQAVRSYLSRYALESHLFDISTEFRVPIVMAVVLDRTGLGPAVCVGSKAHLDAEKACVGALLESIQSRRAGRYTMHQGKLGGPLLNAKAVVDAESRFRYWYRVEMIDHLRSWLEGSETVTYNRVAARTASDVRAVIRELTDSRCSVFVADVTLSELRAYGLIVKKVLVPELMTLPINERTATAPSLFRPGTAYDRTLAPHPWP